MMSARFACFLLLVSARALAQSNPVPHIPVPLINQSNRGGSTTSSSQLPSTRFRAAAHQTTPSQTSGLNFAPAVTYGSGGYYALSVAVADVNGDGKPDLLVANYCGSDTESCSGTVGVLLGNGDGTFQPAVTYASGGVYAWSVVVADVNGDGRPDLVVANDCDIGSSCNNGVVGVLLGNGDGTFQTAVTYASGGIAAHSVAVADVNGDGKPDLLVANFCGSSNCDNGSVGVLLGNGDGTFQPAMTYGSGLYNAVSVAVADVNGDGKPDLLVANYCGTSSSCNNNGMVGVLLGNGDGTFQTAVNYDSDGPFSYEDNLSVADVNGDGTPDLVVAHPGSVGVLLGNGDGTFQTAVTYPSGGADYSTVAVADVNGDGKPDLLVANFCGSSSSCNNGSVGVLLGNGDGTFQAAMTFGSGGYEAWAVAVADVNGDGKPDLLVANCTSSGSCGANAGVVGVLINISLASTTTALTSSPNPSSLEQAVTFTATVTASQFFKFQPTGTVTFTYGSTTLCNAVTLSGGTATCTYSNLPAGTDTVTGAYSGDTNFTPSSGTVNQTVKVTFAGLIELVNQFDTKPDVRAIMVFTLELAQAAERAHATKLADALLHAFIDEVAEQSGKSLTAAQAAILIQDAEALMM